jgi:hypothetical protein
MSAITFGASNSAAKVNAAIEVNILTLCVLIAVKSPVCRE